MKILNYKSNTLVSFFVLTFLLSVPFYILNAFAYFSIIGRPEVGPLYIALFTLTPIVSASILTYRYQGNQGVKDLLKRIFDYKRIIKRGWYLVIVLLPPLFFLLTLLWFVVYDIAVPPGSISYLVLPVIIPFFFILAAAEEVGWMGFAFEPMEKRFGALRAALLLGLIWALWHLPFFLFLMPDPSVLTAQLLTLVGTRVLMAWIFNNTGKSVFGAILFHAFGNAALLTFPEINTIIPWGSVIYFGLILVVALIVIYLWRPQSLARYRFTSS